MIDSIALQFSADIVYQLWVWRCVKKKLTTGPSPEPDVS